MNDLSQLPCRLKGEGGGAGRNPELPLKLVTLVLPGRDTEKSEMTG